MRQFNDQDFYLAERAFKNKDIVYFNWFKNGQLHVTVNSFFDEAIRLEDKNPLMSSNYVFTNEMENYSISMKYLYNLLKTLPVFANMVNG